MAAEPCGKPALKLQVKAMPQRIQKRSGTNLLRACETAAGK
jgi:hypothetical protein